MPITERDKRLMLGVAFLMAGVAAITACASDAAGPPAADSDPAAVAGAVPRGAAGSVPPAADAPPELASGIKGKVLRGPVVGGPEIVGEPSYAPFSATFIVTDGAGSEVARFRSDGEGDFELLLAPGDYLIVPDSSAPVFRPAEQQQPVTVSEGETVELTLRYDTGMR